MFYKIIKYQILKLQGIKKNINNNPNNYNIIDDKLNQTYQSQIEGYKK